MTSGTTSSLAPGSFSSKLAKYSLPVPLATVTSNPAEVVTWPLES